MSEGKRLCLNMIVKNETANLERCLAALAPHIACWVIGDTGSTDGTRDAIMAFFAARDLPGELHSFPFENFEQARNAALDHAYVSPLAWDYLLLADADMELVVEDPEFRARLTAPGYRLLQRSGLTYWNTRLVRRGIRAGYHGVTHEYIDVPGEVEALAGVWYKDHASGANRADKFERDIRLLRKGLEDEPDNHRYWFYLAQSYKDAGRTAEAAEAYLKRAEMGGWDEEAWHARLERARCLQKLGDEGGFLREALAAFNQRPKRAEPLYDLARFYRERGMNEASVLFSEAGLALPPPQGETLFVEDRVYDWGLREEYSIAANYSPDPARKERGFAACNRLALSREVPAGTRELARANLYHYFESAAAILPSFAARPVGFTPPDGYHLSNPSIARQGGEIVMVQRAVNYSVAENGEYRTADGAPVHTRNFLLRLGDALEIRASAEILPPEDMPEPACREVLGFEDLRLFAWREALWCVACVRELTPEGWCEQVLARIDERGAGACRLTDWRVLHPEGPQLHEKNWMPFVEPAPAGAGDDRLRLIYRCDPTRILDEQGRTIAEALPAIAAENFCGGSQMVPFAAGWLALVHEATVWGSGGARNYRHRFVWFDAADALRGVSRPFYFNNRGVEYAAGLAWHPDGKRLLISYGVGDGESWIATVDADEVGPILEDVERLPSGLAPPADAKPRPMPWDRIAASAAARAAAQGEQAERTVEDRKFAAAADGEASKSPPAMRIVTTHGTIFYVDIASGELRHGTAASRPHNARFAAQGERGQILYESDGRLHPVLCLLHGSHTVDSMARGGPAEPTDFEIVRLAGGQIGLKAQGLFLCAEADGRVTLSRTACSAWESFIVSDNPAAAPAVHRTSPGEDRFLELAPFLRAADSPVERRRLSREFDARIGPLLDDGAAALPQIHCFYEVLSDAAQHQSLLAAIASMRAAGHPVRLWSYSPDRLEFLRPHGIELRQAADIVPRSLFERILAGAEIRYFSDVFRYAVLYEQGGLWMDTDVVVLRPFPYRGDHFFNLQWRGGHQGHFICGNVIYARPFSRHLRNLYEIALERFFRAAGSEFGDVGPKLLSDYIASEAGAELRDRVFGPMFFNPIDWTELDRFDRPLADLADYLCDERVFGIHLWNARTNALARGEGASLIALLSDPLGNFPSLTDLADRFATDKNRHSGNHHGYARVYDRLLSPRRFSLRRLMEIGLCRGLAERNQPDMPSVALWQSYFPFCHVTGVDLTDFSHFHSDRFGSFVCDQSKPDEVRAVAGRIAPGSVDVIIDDGSHASYDQQLGLREFFPLLADGGWYFIEDLDWQPPGEDGGKIMPTKQLLRQIRQNGAVPAIDPLGVGALAGQFADILFFDSHYELARANLLGGLAAIRKRGGGIGG